MEWEWLAPAAVTASVAGAAWVTAVTTRSTFQVGREADYVGVQATTFERLLREGRQDQFTPNTAYPIRLWWRPQEAVRLRRSIIRYVGIAIFHDGYSVTQKLAFQARRRSVFDTFASVRDLLAIEDQFPVQPWIGDAAQFSGDGYEVFIWSIRHVPRRGL